MIYYSHVNEDNRVERKVLMSRPYKSLYAIAGSGERVIALMDSPTLDTVYFIDNNWDAIYLCELKMAALRHLSVENYLVFVGFTPSSAQRTAHFDLLKPMLSEGCRRFWSSRGRDIEHGICNCGHFEQFLHNANPIIRFFLGKDFYQCFSENRANWRSFPSLRWRLVKAIFSYRWTYLLFGMKDSAFVSKDAELQVIPAALQQSLDEDGVSHSALFHLVFNGNLNQMPEVNLPPSFQKKVLSRIKAVLENGRLKIHYHYGDVLEVLSAIQPEAKTMSFFSLSDILSFVSLDYQQKLVKLILHAHSGAGTLVFRTFVCHRLTPEQVDDYRRQYSTFKDLSAEERSHFYQVFKIDY